jgi:hypothetical protein
MIATRTFLLSLIGFSLSLVFDTNYTTHFA